MIAGESGFYEFEHNNKKEWIFYAPIGHYGWSFAIRSSEKAANKLVQQNNNNISLWSLVLIILALGLTHLVSKSTIVKPIAFLITTLHELKLNKTSSIKELSLSPPIKELGNLILKHHQEQVNEIDRCQQENSALTHTINEKNTQLRQSQQRLKSFLDAAQNPTVHISKAGNILLVNQKFKDLLKESSFINTSISALIHEDNKLEIAKAMQNVFTQLKRQEIQEIKLSSLEKENITCKAILSPVIMADNEVEASIIFIVKVNA
jgi:PAS domain S-box-containing protein